MIFHKWNFLLAISHDRESILCKLNKERKLLRIFNIMIFKRLREEFQISKFGFGGVNRSTLYDSYVSNLIWVFHYFNCFFVNLDHRRNWYPTICTTIISQITLLNYWYKQGKMKWFLGMPVCPSAVHKKKT